MLIEYSQPPGDGMYNAAYLAALRARNAVTCDDFVKRMTPRMKAKLRAHRFPPDLLEDLAQMVFIAIFEKIDAGEPRDPAKLAQYVSGTCVNMAREALRRLLHERRLRSDVEPDFLTKQEKSALDMVQRKELAGKMREALMSLKPPHRAILVDYFYAGLTPDELCEKYTKNKDQIRMLRFRALEQLLKIWTRYESDDE